MPHFLTYGSYKGLNHTTKVTSTVTGIGVIQWATDDFLSSFHFNACNLLLDWHWRTYQGHQRQSHTPYMW